VQRRSEAGWVDELDDGHAVAGLRTGRLHCHQVAEKPQGLAVAVAPYVRANRLVVCHHRTPFLIEPVVWRILLSYGQAMSDVKGNTTRRQYRSAVREQGTVRVGPRRRRHLGLCADVR